MELKVKLFLWGHIALEAAALTGAAILFYVAPLAVAGVVTTVTSLTFKLWGQPAQIRELVRVKTPVGQSRFYSGLATISYLSWTIYGWRTHDWVIVASQALGVVGSFLMFHLATRYHFIRSHNETQKVTMFWLWNDDAQAWQAVEYLEYHRALIDYYRLTCRSDEYFQARLRGDAGMYGSCITTAPTKWGTYRGETLIAGQLTDGAAPDAERDAGESAIAA